MQIRDERGDEKGAGESRNAYRAPQLIYFGKIRHLTATGTGAQAENAGMDDGNNFKRQKP